MENQAVVVQEEIGNLVVQRDAELVLAITTTKGWLETYLAEAEALVLKKPEDKEVVTGLINSIKSVCKPVVDLIDPIKRQANEQVDKILSVEKLFQTYVPPAQAAKTRTDERFLAWKIIDVLTTKLSAYLDFEEQERRKEEQRLQELAEKERQKELNRISKKLDGLMDKTGDLAEQKRLLEEQLEDTSITVEEAEHIRARIDNIDIKLRPMQERVVDSQIRMEQAATPVTVSMERPKTAGLSESYYWDVEEITNARLLHKAIADGTLSPGVCTGFSFAKLKTYGNDQVKGTSQAPNIPGVRFVKKRKMVVSKGRV